MKRVFIYIFLYILISTKAYSIGVFGNAGMMPMQITGDFTMSAGSAITISVDTNWLFSFGAYNMILNNVNAEFSDANTHIPPKLINNLFEFDVEHLFSISPNSSIAPLTMLAINNVKYNTVLDENYNDAPIYNDYGNDWYFSIMPGISYYYKINEWIRISGSFGYRIAINADYQVPNTDNVVLNNSDMSGIALLIKLQLGTIR